MDNKEEIEKKIVKHIQNEWINLTSRVKEKLFNVSECSHGRKNDKTR